MHLVESFPSFVWERLSTLIIHYVITVVLAPSASYGFFGCPGQGYGSFTLYGFYRLCITSLGRHSLGPFGQWSFAFHGKLGLWFASLRMP